MTKTAQEKALAEGGDSQTPKAQPKKTQTKIPVEKITKEVNELSKEADGIGQGENSGSRPIEPIPGIDKPVIVAPDKKTFNAQQAFDATKIKKGKQTPQIPGSVNPNVMIDANTKEYVHFYVTDYACPRPQGADEQFIPRRPKVILYPHQFVKAYGSTYSNNKRFINITNPFVIYLILKNINEEIIKERFEDELEKIKGVQNKKKRIQHYLKEMKKLRQNGSVSKYIVTLEDIIHIPVATSKNAFGFDTQYVNMFPEGV